MALASATSPIEAAAAANVSDSRLLMALAWCSDFEVRIMSAFSPSILRSIAPAMRLEGWKRATAVASVLRDASRRPKGEGLLLRMRSESVGTIGFMEWLA